MPGFPCDNSQDDPDLEEKVDVKAAWKSLPKGKPHETLEFLAKKNALRDRRKKVGK